MSNSFSDDAKLCPDLNTEAAVPPELAGRGQHPPSAGVPCQELRTAHA